MEYLLALVGAVVGAVVSYFLVNSSMKKKSEDVNKMADLALKEAKLNAKRLQDEAELKVQQITAKAETKNEQIKQKKIQEAKNKYHELRLGFQKEKAQHKLDMKERELDLKQLENSWAQKEQSLEDRKAKVAELEADIESREAEVKAIKENLEKQLKIIARKKEDLDKANEKHVAALEKVANLSADDAKEQLIQVITAKAESDAMSIVKSTITEAKLTANKEAKKIVVQSIQRMCAEYTIENTVSVFNLESDDIKGQIIGREGRNIRAIEAATGAEIVVDDTPEAIVISSFDPIRREVCRLSLKRLVADGRIHPARIEEVVAKVRKELNDQIIEIGERTVIDLDIHGLKPYLVRMVGRMRFRSSYGQNLLKHSIETAHLCALMAAEMGLSPKQVKNAKRAGLLHDIGKVAEDESELSHALIGMKMCEKAKEHPIILNAVGAHHDEIEMKGIISPIVQACDAISGARPGARREIMESYMKRINELEELAMDYEGVQKAYAMQAGRELRVILESEKVTDEYADDLAFLISEKIQNEMQYPGQIRVIVIREKRAIGVAR